MNEDIIAYLISELSETEEEKISVFATKKSVSQKEFFDAAQVGFKSECVLEVWQSEYEGQELVEIHFHGTAKRFSVYRTYEREDGKTELYLTSKVGVFGGN